MIANTGCWEPPCFFVSMDAELSLAACTACPQLYVAIVRPSRRIDSGGHAHPLTNTARAHDAPEPRVGTRGAIDPGI